MCYLHRIIYHSYCDTDTIRCYIKGIESIYLS